MNLNPRALAFSIILVAALFAASLPHLIARAVEPAHNETWIDIKPGVGYETATITTSLFLMFQDGPDEIMRIGPMPHEDRAPDPNWYGTHIRRPEKPEEIKIEIWTKDRRHWKAKWVPAEEDGR